MNLARLNRLVAELCGWTVDAHGWWSHPVLPDQGGMADEPDYTGSLDACAGFEKGLSDEQRCKYVNLMAPFGYAIQVAIFASAEQRCLAYVRTLAPERECELTEGGK